MQNPIMQGFYNRQSPPVPLIEWSFDWGDRTDGPDQFKLPSDNRRNGARLPPLKAFRTPDRMGPPRTLPLQRFTHHWHGTLITAILVCTIGCARSTYRKAADAEAYCLIESRESDPRWALPNRPVEPSPISRMYLGNEQDCGPQPPDDFAAHRYMARPDCKQVHY